MPSASARCSARSNAQPTGNHALDSGSDATAENAVGAAEASSLASHVSKLVPDYKARSCNTTGTEPPNHCSHEKQKLTDEAQPLLPAAADKVAESRERIEKFKSIATFLIGVVSMTATQTYETLLVGKNNEIGYCSRLMYIYVYLLGLCLSALLIVFFEGRGKLRDCFCWPYFLGCLPYTIASTTTDVTDVHVQKYLPGPLKKTISQSKLLMSIVSTRLIRKKNVSCGMFASACGIFFSLVADKTFSLERGYSISNYGYVLFAFLSTFASAALAIVSEGVIERNPTSLLINIARNRINGLSLSIIFCVFELSYRNEWHMFPFVGFNKIVWTFIALKTMQVFCAVAIVIRLSTMMKVLCSVCGTIFWYIVCCCILRSFEFEMIQFLCMLATALNVITFTTTKMKDGELKKLEDRYGPLQLDAASSQKLEKLDVVLKS